MEFLSFQKAKAVWALGRSQVMNDFLLFQCVFEAEKNEKMLLRLTGSTLYRVKLNGEFLGYGPARGPKGVFRIDEMAFCAGEGQNVLEIEISGANVNSYYYMDHPSFLQAELFRNGNIVAWTGKHFKAYDLTCERIQKVPRFSFQRMFSEAYRVSPHRHNLKELDLEVFPSFRYLARTVPFPDYKIDTSYKAIRTFRRSRQKDLAEVNAHIQDPRPDFKCYPYNDPDYCNTYTDLKQLVCDEQGSIVSTLYAGKINNTGFIRLKVNCKVPGK